MRAKKFLIGQRVIYAGIEIVVCVRPARDHREGMPNDGMRQWVRNADGVVLYADPINLKPLPGGQL